MKCWRDLSKECAERDCPMWMARFDLPKYADAEELGLSENKCALVLNEKIGVFRQMVGLMDDMEAYSDDFEDEIFDMMEAAGKKADKPKVPTAAGAKKPRLPAKNKGAEGKGKQLPL
jgi:hypothetical protein